MRVQLLNDASANSFSNQLLQLGEGKHPFKPYEIITLPTNFCVMKPTIQEMIDTVFINISTNYKNHNWLHERGILSTKNDDVNRINHYILQKIPGPSVKYKSIDTVIEEHTAVNYPIEFLNSLEITGLPPHVLILKIGAPLMIIRNLDPPKLCNGTRVIVKLFITI